MSNDISALMFDKQSIKPLIKEAEKFIKQIESLISL